MTPLDELQCRYDGPIPETEWAAAAAATREEAMKRSPRSRPAAPVRDTRPLPDRMAAHMLEAARLRGRCHRQDLLQAGFSPAEIDAHADAARAIAGKTLKIEVPA